MADPFTIHIYVPDGDPAGVRIINRMNWTGIGIIFPRSRWQDIRKRAEFERAGVYILTGYAEQTDAADEEDELPTVYIGQADGLRSRIDTHAVNKEFWDAGCVFVSTNANGLNRAHITWLEWSLILRAQEARRCHLDNGATPQEPCLSESEKADTQGFLKEILQIVPLVGIQAFEIPKPVADPDSPETQAAQKVGLRTDKDTIIVPAQEDGFKRVFLGENCWYSVRISGGMLPCIKWIAAYQSQPVSAVTHIAEVDKIEPYGDSGKYKVIFKRPAEQLAKPIPFGDARSGAMQSPRYTTIERLRQAVKLSDVLSQ